MLTSAPNPAAALTAPRCPKLNPDSLPESSNCRVPGNVSQLTGCGAKKTSGRGVSPAACHAERSRVFEFPQASGRQTGCEPAGTWRSLVPQSSFCARVPAIEPKDIEIVVRNAVSRDLGMVYRLIESLDTTESVLRAALRGVSGWQRRCSLCGGSATDLRACISGAGL